MYVHKRSGSKVPFVAAKITARVNKFTYGLHTQSWEVDAVVEQALEVIKDNMRTRDIDDLVCEILDKNASETGRTDYGVLYVRLKMSNLHKQTKKRFSDVVAQIREAEKEINDEERTINDEDYVFIKEHQSALDSAIISHRDYEYTITEVEKVLPLLYRIDDQIIERPSHFAMRRAIDSSKDLDEVIDQYERFSSQHNNTDKQEEVECQ